LRLLTLLGEMRIAFTVRSIPELAHLPAERRDAVWQRCHHKAFRHWQTWLALLVSLGLFSGGFYIAVFAQSGDSLSWGRILLGLVFVFVGSGGFFPVHVAMARRYVAEELSQ
jgi:hypothetical protein